ELAIRRPAGGDGEAAVADHRRGDAERGRGRSERIPGELRVVVGVVVDDARHQRQTVGVDGFAVLLFRSARFKDYTPGNSKIASRRGATQAVEEKRIADHEVVHAPMLPLRRIGFSRTSAGY